MDSAREIRRTLLDDVNFPPFIPRAPWWGGDLQTLRNYLVGRPDELGAFPATRLEFPMPDGSGDRLVGTLSQPVADAAERPLVILIHGLTGCEASLYILKSALLLLSEGYTVLRVNLRGAGPSRPLCRFQYHAGRTEDLRAVLAQLPPDLRARGVVPVGYSLGGNMLLKFMGEGVDPAVRGAVAVSAPLDLAAASRCFLRWRNRLYHRHLLTRMKAESTAPTAEISAVERRAIAAARSVLEFDDRFVAPRNGFTGAADYYRRSSAMRFLDSIDRPMLVIHALDDPWIPADAYRAYDWRRNTNLVPLLPARGGHVGFQGQDRRAPWHDLCIRRFVAAL